MDNRIILEPILTQEDFPFFAQLAFHETVMTMNMGRVFTQEEAEGYFAHILTYRKTHPFSGTHKVLRKDSGELIGIASIWEYEDCAEVEYMLLPEYWNLGYATEIVGILERKATDYSNCPILKGITDPNNIPSQRVLVKNGFVLSETETLEDGSTISIYTKKIKGKE